MGLDCKWTWRAILKNTITSTMTADYCHWKMLLSKMTRLGPKPKSGAAPRLRQVVALFVLLSADISRTRVGRYFLEGGWERIILIVTPPFLHKWQKRPISAGVYSSAKHGRLYSQPPSVNNVPNNYVTVFGLPCEKVSPPSPAVLQYANGKKAKVWELDLMEWSQATVLKQSEWHL